MQQRLLKQGKGMVSLPPIKKSKKFSIYSIMPASVPNEIHSISCPLYTTKVPAGFPSPVDDLVEETLDLNRYLIQHPAATFFVRVSGDSMIQAGIHDQDLLIVDRSLEPLPGKIVIAAIDGELTVKRLIEKNGVHYLKAENPSYPAIELKPEHAVYIWGVVTSVIHSL